MLIRNVDIPHLFAKRKEGEKDESKQVKKEVKERGERKDKVFPTLSFSGNTPCSFPTSIYTYTHNHFPFNSGKLLSKE